MTCILIIWLMPKYFYIRYANLELINVYAECFVMILVLA
jgi:hypothetical protein